MNRTLMCTQEEFTRVLTELQIGGPDLVVDDLYGVRACPTSEEPILISKDLEGLPAGHVEWGFRSLCVHLLVRMKSRWSGLL